MMRKQMKLDKLYRYFERPTLWLATACLLSVFPLGVLEVGFHWPGTLIGTVLWVFMGVCLWFIHRNVRQRAVRRTLLRR